MKDEVEFYNDDGSASDSVQPLHQQGSPTLTLIVFCLWVIICTAAALLPPILLRAN